MHTFSSHQTPALIDFILCYSGRAQHIANGFSHVPCAAGSHEIEVPTWRPTGSLQDEFRSFFLRGVPQLKTDEIVFDQAWEDRCKLVTIPSGTVHVQVDVLMRHSADQQLQWA